MTEAFESILLAAKDGAEWAWSRLYHDVAGPVRGYLAMRGATDPDDLLGEVFLQVARNLDTFDGDEAGFRSWVFVIAHHRVVDERRYRSRRPVEPTAEPDRHRVGGDVEEEALEHIGTRQVLQALEELSPDQRDVLLLRVVGDLTIEQISAAVHKRPGAVKALQRRGLAVLRRQAERRGVPL